MLEAIAPRGLVLRAPARPQAQSPTVLLSEIARNAFAGPEGIHPPQRYLDLVRQYGNAVWVYACVHRKAMDTAGIPLDIKLRQADGPTLTEVTPNHPMRLLFNREGPGGVNPYMSFTELREIDCMNLELSGNAYWLLFANRRGLPVEIWPLRPDWVKIIPDAQNFVRGYTVRVEGGDPTVFEPIATSATGTGILHFRQPNPWNYWYGQGPMTPAWGSVQIEERATEYRHSFYKNSARLDGILVPDGGPAGPGILTETQVESIREFWRGAFQGSANAHRTAVLPAGLKYQAISISPKDAEIFNDRKLSREDIIVVFGVSLAVLGIETGDVGRREEQIKHYYESTVKPWLSRYVSTINDVLGPRFGPNLVVEPDYSGVRILNAADLVQAQVDEIRLRSAVVVVNEIRERDGLDPVEWGDAPLLPLGVQPLGSEPPDPNPSPSPGNEPPDDMPMMEPQKFSAGLVRRMRASRFTEETRAAIWEDFVAKTGQQEDLFKTGIKAALSAMEKSLTSFLEQGYRPDTSLKASVAVLRRGLREVAEKRLPEVMHAAWKRAAALAVAIATGRKGLKAEGPNANLLHDLFRLDEMFNVQIPRLAEYLHARPVRYGDYMAASLSERFRGLFAGLADEGASIAQMAEAVHSEFSILSETRATLIARTEVISASNLSAMVAYHESKAVEAQEWLTAQDERVRGMDPKDEFSHVAADGEEARLGTAFNRTGEALMFPGDPSGSIGNIANCRCTTIPVIKPLDEGEP